MRYLRQRGVLSILVGCISGWLLPSLAQPSLQPVMSTILGGLYGGIFALLSAKHPFHTGSGLIWGLAYAFLLWLTVPCGIQTLLVHNQSISMLDEARAQFPVLVAYILAFGVPFGLIVAIGQSGRDRDTRSFVALWRPLLLGAVSGLLASMLFGGWLKQQNAIVFIAGITHTHPSLATMTIQIVGAMLFGMGFGLLFYQDIYRYGSSLCWGVAYSILWWFLGSLTLQPLFARHSLDWSITHATQLYGTLIGSIVYGAILGFIYALLDRFWRGLFIESDPLKRDGVGVGTRTLLSFVMGIAASIIGGLLFSIIMVATGVLPIIASLVGASSPLLGFLVHLIISSLIGMSYGFLFAQETNNGTSSIAWGMLYGLIWWFIGPLTLLPLLLGRSVTWTVQAADLQLPSLFGHLLYGAALGLVFLWLARRYANQFPLAKRFLGYKEFQLRISAIAIPALWLFVLGLGVVLPIVLG